MLSALALVILAPLFLAYFKSFVEAQVQDVVMSQPATQYEETKAAALAELRSGPMPIDRAVEAMAQRGRDADPTIAPSQSDDVSSVEGWGEVKDEAAGEAARRAVERRKAAEEAARLAAEAAAEAAGEGAPGDASLGAEGEATLRPATASP